MKSTLAEKGPWQKAVEVVLDAEDVNKRLGQVVARYRERAAIPGFRKGKVPANLVQSTFAPNIERDLLNELLPECLDRVIEEHDLRLAAPPTVTELSFRHGEPLKFTATFDLFPIIEPKDYQGLELEVEETEVDDKLIDEFLENLRQRAARGTPVLRPSQPGDVVDISVQPVDIHGNRLPKMKREDIRLEAGGANLLPEFKEATVGVSNGEQKLLHVKYPETTNDPNLAGQERRYRMKVLQVVERHVPELNDAFATAVDGSATLEELRTKVRLRYEGEEKMRAQERLEEALIGKLIDANPFDVPEPLVQAAHKRAMEQAKKDNPNATEEELATALQPMIVRRWKRDVLLESIARKESLALTDDEFEQKLSSLLAQERDPAAARRRLEKEGRIPTLRTRFQEQKTFGFLLEGATVHRILKPREAASPADATS